MADESVNVVLGGVGRPFLANKDDATNIYRFYHIWEAPSKEIVLLSAASATGSFLDWPGSWGMWAVYGTFGGSSAKLQMSPDGGTTAMDVEGAVRTTNGAYAIRIPALWKLRVVITGGAGITLTSKMKQM